MPIILKTYSEATPTSIQKVFSKQTIQKYLEEWLFHKNLDQGRSLAEWMRRNNPRKRKHPLKRQRDDLIILWLGEKSSPLAPIVAEMLVDFLLDCWKIASFKNLFQKIWNFEEVEELMVIQKAKLCNLCFSRIICPTDVMNISNVEEQIKSKGVNVSLLILCDNCKERLLKNNNFFEVVEKYIPAQPLITLFAFLLYLSELNHSDDSSQTCWPFAAKFKYNFGLGNLDPQWCPIYNKKVTCHHHIQKISWIDGSISHQCHYGI
jgi:hypothetical protein